MRDEILHSRARLGRRIVGLTLGFGFSVVLLTGCDDLLDVPLEDRLVQDDLNNPTTATTQRNSAIAITECAYSAFVAGSAAGMEDIYLRVDEDFNNFNDYELDPPGGECDTSDDDDYDWWDPFQQARDMSEGAYERITEFPEDEIGADKEQILAVVALYAAIPYDVFGEHMCEVAIDLGPLMTPDQTLATAEEWVNTAMTHIGNAGGDFEVQNGITGPSDGNGVETMAYGLRARIRWARGDLGAAAADAAMVPQGYMAWATREGDIVRRRNKIVTAHGQALVGNVMGPVDWWNPGDRTNPVTDSPWPDPIPFTGYRDLGVVDNAASADHGRAVFDDGTPVTTAVADAVADPRVPVNAADIPDLDDPDGEFAQAKYTSEGDDIPLINWKEMWLIRAEAAGGQTAIDLVNEVRAADGLPPADYADPTDADQIEDMILEERRRALFLEGRFWSTKIQNTDKLWFPRATGAAPDPYLPADFYQGGVRMAMDPDEYFLNPNFETAARGTGCDPDQAPVVTVGGG